MGRLLPVATTLFNRGHRLARHPGEGGDLSFEGERLGCHRAVLQGVSIAPGSPATGAVDATDPRASNRRGAALSPLAFDRAWHRDAWCIAKSMRLFLRFFGCPDPLGGGGAHIPNDRPAGSDLAGFG